jgi:hypothetical protein
MNKRIIKAVRAGNDFKADWLRAERNTRCSFSYMRPEIGLEEQKRLIQQRGLPEVIHE